MFFKKLTLQLEIIGYSRAIGHMISQPGVTAEHMEGLHQGREDAIKRLAELKLQQRDERFGKTMRSGFAG